MTKALQDAEKAQDTADSKRRVFVSQPVPPYEVGDLWVQGSTGDILRCKTAKTFQQSYSSSDWVLASKYTDDTAADAAQATANANTTAIGSLNTRVTQAETSITQTQNEIELMASEIETELEDIRSDTEFATPYISATPPEEAPEAGKLWLDEGAEPSVLRKWRGADVTTEREYTYDIFGCGKNLLPPRLAQTVAGVTYTPQSDGTYIANGTCTGASTFEILPSCVLPPGKYALSGGNGGIRLILAVYDAQGGWLKNLATSHNGVAAVVQIEALSGNEAYHRVIFQGTSGAEVNNVVLSPQLEAGDTATAFEPYEDVPFLALGNAQGQIESVAVEAGYRAKQEMRKNLFPSLTSAVTWGGLTVSPQADGTVVISGTATERVTVYTYTGTLPDGQYTISGGTYNASVALIAVDTNNQWKRTIGISWGNQRTFNFNGLLDGEDHIRMMIQTANDSAGQTFDNVVLSPQLEAGGTATAFEPYKSVLPITGRDGMEIVACGKNLFPSLTSAVTGGGLTFSPQADGTVVISGTATGLATVYTYTGMLPDGQYTISGGVDNASVALIAVDTNNQWKRTIGISWGNQRTFNFNGLLDGEDHIRMMIQTANDSAGQTFNNVVLSPQLEAGGTATAFEPYASMGGGTIAPTEPLYGLPGAEDTVDVSVDGDVTVTRRTAVLELDGTEDWEGYGITNGYLVYVSAPAIKQISSTYTIANMVCSHYPTIAFYKLYTGSFNAIGQSSNSVNVSCVDSRFQSVSAWKSYLAAQAAAGTPVTIVYELAAPETEALTAISPIAPQAGQLNLATDADALTATIHGSGWETVNDTSSIQDALANLDGDLASLINEVGLLNGEVGSIAQQIISPDGIKNIVFESTEYQAMANTVELNANELSVTQATVTDINGRVETIEGTVRISGSNIDIGRSDSNVQLHLDNTGWSISEGGQETIYARQNRVVAPRFQTTSLIFGALAFNSSGGHFRLMKYGG